MSTATRVVGMLAFGLAVGMTSSASAQEAVPDNPAWGTSTESVVVIPATAFMARDPATTWVSTNGRLRQSFVGTSFWYAGVQLPTGASITRVTMEACDTTPTGLIVASLSWDNTLGQGGLVTNIFGTGLAPATPGCSVFPATVTPRTVNNDTEHLTMLAQWQGDFSGSAAELIAFRVYYKLQVSPAPGTATFADVPVGDPLHRFVEALVAAGITGGCGGGNYCPNTPVTRGQMAVFLSAALGLHWPN